jgi:hypothetical protein
MNRTLNTPNEFGFLMRGSLIMHSSKNPFSFIIRNIALDRPEGDTVSLKLPLAPRSCKEAPGVFNLFRVNQERTLEPHLGENHE